eukprot:gene23215-9532_t
MSKDYSDLIHESAIDGIVLKDLSKDDWKEVGITVFGDNRKLAQLKKDLDAGV